jgi:type IV pilus biogenesis protein CpaD/CtpE
MKRHFLPLILPVLLMPASCQPAVATYTKIEAPAGLTIDSAARQVALRFLPGSDRLVPGARAHLLRLAATGGMRPADRVQIAASGPPLLMARRQEAIARALLGYGIIARPLLLADLPPDWAVVEIGRYTVELPPCPNWSGRPYSEFTNQPPSYYGCATATDLGLMVASPADLVGGLPLAPADGEPAVSAVARYLHDKAYPPVAPGAPTPFSGGGGGGASGGGGAGSSP